MSAVSGGETRVHATAEITFDVHTPALLSLQVVAAGGPASDLVVDLDGRPLPVQEVVGPERYARQHLVRPAPGRLTVRYDRTVVPDSPGESVPADQRDASATSPRAAADVDPGDRLVMLRPSRFCPSDRLVRYAATRLPGADTPAVERVAAIADHVHEHLAYVAGVTGPTDDAVDVLLAGQGVCRDFAHLVVTLARSQGMAARYVSVYAPGLTPMDFHAVAEVEADGVWHLADATRLAPRGSFARISTGRDAADTAFATVVEGAADLVDVTVTPVAVDGLPTDDGRGPEVLA
jgi:transglutaminase-like putative cysteine protease